MNGGITQEAHAASVRVRMQVRLRQKLSLSAVKNFFTGSEDKDPAVEKLEELKV